MSKERKIPKYYKGYTYIKTQHIHKIKVTPCTCGRENKDLTDCFAVFEFFKRINRANGEVIPSKMAHVVCGRPGCFGEWITSSSYVDTLPMIYYNDWLRQQKASIKESQVKAEEQPM